MNTTTITTKQGTFTVSAKLAAEGVKFPFEKEGKPYHNSFRITVKNEAGRLSFLFYDSQNNYSKGITEMEADDLKSAFECFVSDSICADDSFPEFCANLGYDEDSRSAERIYKACKKQGQKLSRIFTGDVYELANELND